jgi:hypothetical protein
MLPQSKPPPEDGSPRVNLLISLAFHLTIILALAFFAARQGLLGKQLKKITVEMVKETPPPKPKEPEKSPDIPKPPPAIAETPKPAPVRTEAPRQAAAAPPPVAVAPPAVAPAPAELPSFQFDGGKTVQTSSDPVLLYKALVEAALRSNWRRPTGISDDNYVAEVEVGVDPRGRVSDPVWKKGSGDARWDDSVRQAISATKAVDHAPPAAFPNRFLVRFDVTDVTESTDILQ